MHKIYSKLLLETRMTSIKRQSSFSVSQEKKSKKMSNLNLLSTHSNITKSASDEREYHGFLLHNKMKVMVISDPKTEKSAASMDVHIGSNSDPIELPGLAHFCEHMLFMGTEKYPDEDDYSKFISQNAGSCNAYTSGEHTNYYFDIKKDKLRDILDRFSQFFISPLFDVGSTDREVKAVHSEHEKNVMSDVWRADQIDKENSDPTHDYHKFGTGNKDTLDEIPKKKGINVREELLKFHARYYSANIMSLSVIGAEPVETLKEMVVEMFSDITNKDVIPPYYENSPYRPQDLQLQLEVVPVKDVRYFNMRFPIPDYTSKYKTKPGDYISHLIGHEGAGSLLSSLKKNGLVNTLSAGEEEASRGFGFFDICCDLTEEGVGRVDEIIEMTFQYINMLKSNKPEERIFNEIRDIASMGFTFKDKEKPCSCVLNIAEAMHYYPMEDVLSAPKLVSEFEPKLIEEFMSHLIPQNIRVTITTKSCESKANVNEKWYGTQYHVEKINADTIDKWAKAPKHAEHFLPATNEFIATNFSISAKPQSEESNKYPYVLKKTALSRLWFKQDDQFKLPKSILKFQFSSPCAYSSPANTNMVYLFVELFKDSLNEYAYDAEIAGLSYKLYRSFYGLELEIRGYNEKQIVLLEKIVSKLAKFKITPKRFKIYKEKYTRSLKNFKADQPHKHTNYYSSALRTSKFWLNDQLLTALADIEVDMLQNFTQEFLSKLYVESLMHGNITTSEAIKISDMVEEILTDMANTSPEENQERFCDMMLDSGVTYVYKENHKVREISATEVYYQVGQQTKESNMLLSLLVQIIDDPCFNILRTKEQLGYIVSTSPSRSNGVAGLKILVQSKKSPDYLDGRIEAFVHSIQDILEKTDEKEYSEHVASLSTKILEKPKKLSTETYKYWSEITSQQYQFERSENEAEYLNTITKNDVIDFYNRFIRIDAAERRKLAVYIIGKKLDTCGDAPGDITGIDKDFLKTPSLPKATMVESIADFKKDREAYPRMTPYIEINQTAKL